MRACVLVKKSKNKCGKYCKPSPLTYAKALQVFPYGEAINLFFSLIPNNFKRGSQRFFEENVFLFLADLNGQQYNTFEADRSLFSSLCEQKSIFLPDCAFASSGFTVCLLLSSYSAISQAKRVPVSPLSAVFCLLS